jgi:hypothetical protein
MINSGGDADDSAALERDTKVCKVRLALEHRWVQDSANSIR